MNVLRLAVAMLLGLGLPLAVQLLDRRRLPAAARARAWNVATWGAAVYAFGPLSMLGWCWVTRPRWRRVWTGAASTATLVAAIELVDVVLRAELRGALADVGLAAGATALGAGALLATFELVVAARRRMH